MKDAQESQACELLQQHPVLSAKVVAAIDIAVEEVPNAIREVIRFLDLVADNKTGKLTPSHRVDLVWHEFILFTKSYADFCEKNYGRFLHHHPGGLDSENKRQFQRTLDAYRMTFGEPPTEYWGVIQRRTDDTIDSTAECGFCEA